MEMIATLAKWHHYASFVSYDGVACSGINTTHYKGDCKEATNLQGG
jgi:hypothetical protein